MCSASSFVVRTHACCVYHHENKVHRDVHTRGPREDDFLNIIIMSTLCPHNEDKRN